MKQFPALKAATFVCLGILADRHLEVPWIPAAAAYILLILLACLIRAPRKKGFLLCICLVLLGALRHGQATRMLPANHVSRFLDGDNFVLVRAMLIRDPETRPDRTMMILETDSLSIRDTTIAVCGKVQVSANRKYRAMLDSLLYGDVIRVSGFLEKPSGARNPGGFDYRAYLERNGIYGILRLAPPSVCTKTGISGGNWIRKWIIYPARRYILRVVERTSSEEGLGLLKATLVEDRTLVPQEIMDDFSRTGLIHLVAVSGLHVGYILVILTFVTGFLRLPFTINMVFQMAGIIFFTLLAEAKPPVVRAAVMSCTLLFGKIIKRKAVPENMLGFSALVVLLAGPCNLFDIGFQLSYGAIFSILFIYGKLEKIQPPCLLPAGVRNSTLFRNIQSMFWMSVAAQLGTMPITAYHFNRIPLLSVFLNIPAIPLFGIIIGIAFTTVLFSLISGWIAEVYAVFNASLIHLTLQSIARAADLPFSSCTVPSPSLLQITLYVLILLLFLGFQNRGFRNKILICLLACANLYAWRTAFQNSGHNLRWIQFDVGDGDAALLELPRGKKVLIDGGETRPGFDCGRHVLSRYLDRTGIRKLDAVILTHAHSDHIGGLMHIVRHYRIGQWISSGIPCTVPEMTAMDSLLASKRIPRKHIFAPDSLDFPGVRMHFLWPCRDDSANNPAEVRNDDSIVLRVCFGRTSLLFTGDAGIAVEKKLLSLCNLHADAVKIGHHGSKTSSGEAFLKTVQPGLAVISCARGSRHGFPAPRTLRTLGGLKIPLARTDLEGAVMVESNGDSLYFADWRR